MKNFPKRVLAVLAACLLVSGCAWRRSIGRETFTSYPTAPFGYYYDYGWYPYGYQHYSYYHEGVRYGHDWYRSPGGLQHHGYFHQGGNLRGGWHFEGPRSTWGH